MEYKQNVMKRCPEVCERSRTWYLCVVAAVGLLAGNEFLVWYMTKLGNKSPIYSRPQNADQKGNDGDTGHWFPSVAPFIHIGRNYTQMMHDKWIVADYSSSQCANRMFEAPPEWRWIVIGGKSHTLTDCISPNCIAIDSSVLRGVRLEGTQQKMPTSQSLQAWWLNIAFLTAISHGAEYILEVDCRLHFTDAPSVLGSTPPDFSGLMYNSTQHFNIHEFLQAWASVPHERSQSHGKDNNSRTYFLRNMSRIYIKHGLDPWPVQNVDEKYGRRGNLRLNSSVPPVFTGQSTFAPSVACCTLYHQQAFWGMFYPFRELSSPNPMQPRESVTIRQYIGQRLLKEVDGFTGFLQVQTALKARAELSAFGRVLSTLETFLSDWTCPPELDFSSCVITLVSDLVYIGWLNSDNLEMVKSWVASLKATQLPEPTRVYSPWRGVRKVSEVRLVLGHRTVTLGTRARLFASLHYEFVVSATSGCGGTELPNFDSLVTHWNKPVFEEIVLVVVFNSNKYFFRNLPYLETIHRPSFRHIVYCVPEVQKLLADERRHWLSHVTLIEALSDSWYLLYECVADAAAINIPGVRGYLQIGDDTLVNTWMLRNISRDSMWLPSGINRRRAETNFSWIWWNTPNGRLAVLKALATLEELSRLTSDQILYLDPGYNASSSLQTATFSALFQDTSKILSATPSLLPGSKSWRLPSEKEARTFLLNYVCEHGMAGNLAHKPMDFFYIPQTLMHDYITFSRFFMRYRAMDELALPVMHYGIAHASQIVYVDARTLWGEARDKVPEMYNQKIVFLHPLKLSDRKSRTFFCQNYIGPLFSKLLESTR